MGREDAPLASIQCSDVLSEVSNHTSDTRITVTENTNGKDLKVISSTDSTSMEELSSRSNFVPDQSSKENDKKIFLSGKAVVEEIISDNDTCPEQCDTLWITFDRHILQMTDKAVLEHGEELSN